MKKHQYFQKKSVVYAVIATAIVFLFALPFFVTARSIPWISINNNEYNTKVRKIDLQLWAPAGVQKMKISNLSSLSDARWESYARTKQWYLDYGSGERKVYVKYLDKDDKESSVYSDTVYLNPDTKMDVSIEIEDDQEDVFKRQVDIDVQFSQGVEEISFSNTNDFSEAIWIPVHSKVKWMLSLDEGEKTVYMRAKDARGNVSVVSDDVNYVQIGSEIEPGSIVRSKKSGLYYFGNDGKIHPFLSLAAYHTWHKNFDRVLVVSNSRLASYQVGSAICMKPGTWLIKTAVSDDIYAVEPGCRLWTLRSKVEANMLYGEDWEKRVLTVSATDMMMYTIVDRGENNDTTDDIDKDNDGLTTTEETKLKTSDNKRDTDGDGVSDYEEVRFWFTDPKAVDTDGDSYGDGAEILKGFVPNGVGEIIDVPDGYEYPIGAFDGNHLFRLLQDRNISIRTFDYSYNEEAPHKFINNRVSEL